jgi:hypothetical protein
MTTVPPAFPPARLLNGLLGMRTSNQQLRGR